MALDPHIVDKNVARLMVRRHLRSWTRSDIISEELLVAMFIKAMKLHPDLSMRDVAIWVDGEIRDLVAIVLGTELSDSDEREFP